MNAAGQTWASTCLCCAGSFPHFRVCLQSLVLPSWSCPARNSLIRAHLPPPRLLPRSVSCAHPLFLPSDYSADKNASSLMPKLSSRCDWQTVLPPFPAKGMLRHSGESTPSHRLWVESTELHSKLPLNGGFILFYTQKSTDRCSLQVSYL